jgi:hypothetical protein
LSWKGQARKPLDGLRTTGFRTRSSQWPGDSLGRSHHMEHERGAFKVNSGNHAVVG